MKDRHILLIEDEPDDVKLTMMALKKNRIANEVHVAWDGEEALNYNVLTGFVAPSVACCRVTALRVCPLINCQPSPQVSAATVRHHRAERIW